MKKSVQVTLLGQPLTLTSDQDAAHVERVARFVNAKVEELRAQGNLANTNTLLLVAAMNIADEFLRSTDRERDRRAQVREKIAKMQRLIHSHDSDGPVEAAATDRGPAKKDRGA